jgi:hypothetical protein
MAIKRLRPKIKTFEYEGILVGVRRPTVSEAQQILELRARYLRSLRAEAAAEIETPTGLAAEGDVKLVPELHLLVSELLTCDPENAFSPWFARDANDTTRDQAKDVPAEFHRAAFEAYSAAESDTPKPEGSEPPLAASAEKTSETTFDSAGSSSPSASTSED